MAILGKSLLSPFVQMILGMCQSAGLTMNSKNNACCRATRGERKKKRGGEFNGHQKETFHFNGNESPKGKTRYWSGTKQKQWQNQNNERFSEGRI
ncbi:hypothetical protein [Brevibacillus borstelensis]|uniref:hypothetical protein n=1 Tax=Brevibacillus borstelensis TaxID=45462 RepID=UPI0030BB4E20